MREEEYRKLSDYLSERANIKYQAEVEIALVRVLARRGICPEKVAREVETAVAELTAEEVYNEEARTRHNIRALVNCIQKRVSPEARPYVHFTTTSFDVIDTASALRYKKVTRGLILPVLLKLEKVLMEIVLREKGSVQIGRTHGQHAVPITFGFALAEYVSRLGGRIELIRENGDNLPGKMAGAVGAYNASGLFFDDPEDFEREVLAELGLKPADHSTQIVEPEYLTDYIHALISCFGVLASLSDDMRHLQRSEIGEIGEFFADDQVGSSTMPHKRNPINYENVKSLWKEFMPRMITRYQDQLSEHQRDLTNSASSRFIPEIIAALLSAANRLTRVFNRMVVDRDNIRHNFETNKEMIVAEPLYILLASYGHPDAHEAVRKLTLQAREEGTTLRKIMYRDTEIKGYLDKFSSKQLDILDNPRKYTGISEKKAEAVVNKWSQRLGITLK